MQQLILMMVVLLFMTSSWKMALAVIVGMIILFAGNLIMKQESIVYVPCVMPGMQKPSDNPETFRSPAERKLDFEDVYLKTADGLRIHGWFIRTPRDSESAPTVLFCHANAGNIGLRLPNFAEMVQKLQTNIFALDYRGYGNSEGEPSEEGLIEDALCAWHWLRTAASEGRIDGDQLFVFGRSLGGAVAIALVHELQQRSEAVPRGVLLENTFTCISDLVDVMFPFLAFKTLKDRFLRLRWESIERVKDIKVPLLFLTGEQDEMIPPSHSSRLHKNAENSRLRRQVLFPSGMHNDTWEKGGEKYWTAWSQFFKDCTAKGVSTTNGVTNACHEENGEEPANE